MPTPSPQQRYRYITEYVTKLYDVPLYERHGTPHPVIFYPTDVDQRSDINSLLGQAPRERLDDFAIYNYAYLHTLQNSNRHLYNGTTFALKRIRKQPLRIDAAYGTYFDMLATCATLDDELRAAATRRFIRVPMRAQLHRTVDAKTSLTHGKGRSAAIGGATLVVYNDGDTYRALLSQRTAQHATRPNHMHVIPAFIFQPQAETMQPHEWDLEHHVLREWLEELFGLPEQMPFDDHPALHDWQQMHANGDARLYALGITMNVLTLRPELCMLMLIHDPDWWQRITAANSNVPLNTSAETAGRLIHLDVLETDHIIEHLPEQDYANIPPHALVTIWEGIDLTRLILTP